MEIYRTKVININKKQYTIRFAVNKDGSAYTMFVSNDVNGKQTKYNFAKQVANDFNQLTGEDLERSVMDFIIKDIEKGIV